MHGLLETMGRMDRYSITLIVDVHDGNTVAMTVELSDDLSEVERNERILKTATQLIALHKRSLEFGDLTFND